jgi:uncharacterized membrane protein (GlpM family)
MYYILKVLISAILIVAITEISKRSTLMAGILASIPLVSVLAMIWIYVDTKNIETISKLSLSVFWLVIPSLILFITLPIFLKYINFYISLLCSISLTIVGYYVMVLLLRKYGISL